MRPTGSTAAAFCDLGLVAYQAAHALQLALAARRRQGQLAHDLFLLVEHPPVYTLGRHGSRAHLGVDEHFLRAKGIEVVTVERGGEITYHGPGQLVVYPILDLRRRWLGLRDYVSLLEELMLRLAADCGVVAGRDPRNHGVWVGDDKLGSIGIAIRHGIAFHGLALNVDPDLEPFAWINPCGLAGIGMTSLAREGCRGAMARVRARLPHHLTELFAVDPCPLDRDLFRADFPLPPSLP
ncbi:MAG: lipoyl(octanoyl) transferase LipB [Desulfobulbus sp.]|uniref:lipoyl(octanoyl) transferase LipB n=1 Tax=Desulfobulbus sp. TaxID=895 RepID=UPI00284B0E72|nr:lipoyl(octanoyl) transferase LipB [Desulfobulbus sp.]MDR2551193.1 lipoyl(octanoyl) transferase LipB [Desulfobulbus sp.]